MMDETDVQPAAVGGNLVVIERLHKRKFMQALKFSSPIECKLRRAGKSDIREGSIGLLEADF